VAVASAEQYASHLHLAANRQPYQRLVTHFFTDWMFFLPLNQWHQGAEGVKNILQMNYFLC